MTVAVSVVTGEKIVPQARRLLALCESVVAIEIQCDATGKDASSWERREGASK